MEQYADASPEVLVTGYDDSQCRTCGKRQSPSSSQLGIYNTEIEPRTKKHKTQNLNYHPLLGSDIGLNGYAEIKLPTDFNAVMNLSNAGEDSPHLKRCVSDPYTSPCDGNKNNAGGGLECDGLLRRCVSDPYHSPGVVAKNQAQGGVGATTSSPLRGVSPGGGGRLPPLYPGTNRLSNDAVTPTKVVTTECITEPSPDSLRLMRMKQRMKEMTQWWDDVVREDDETPDAENINAADGATATAAADSKDVDDKELEEQIRVEKLGDGLKIKLNCPCGSGYELLLTGHCCYYKIL